MHFSTAHLFLEHKKSSAKWTRWHPASSYLARDASSRSWWELGPPQGQPSVSAPSRTSQKPEDGGEMLEGTGSDEYLAGSQRAVQQQLGRRWRCRDFEAQMSPAFQLGVCTPHGGRRSPRAKHPPQNKKSYFCVTTGRAALCRMRVDKRSISASPPAALAVKVYADIVTF